MKSKDRVPVTVMVADDHKDSMARVASDLKAHGFEIAEMLGAIGVLTGSAPLDALAKLSSVPGVSAVEKSRDDYRAV